LTSDQYVYITSKSRIPVIRKNSYHNRSSASQDPNGFPGSACS